MNAPFKMTKVLTERGVVVDKKAKQSKPKLLIGKITLNCMYLCHAATSSLGIGMCTILVSDSHAPSMYLFASENGACTTHHCLCGNFGKGSLGARIYSFPWAFVGRYPHLFCLFFFVCRGPQTTLNCKEKLALYRRA